MSQPWMELVAALERDIPTFDRAAADAPLPDLIASAAISVARSHHAVRRVHARLRGDVASSTEATDSASESAALLARVEALLMKIYKRDGSQGESA